MMVVFQFLMTVQRGPAGLSQSQHPIWTQMLYSIARAAGVHFNHCVSPSVRPWSDSVNAHNSRTTHIDSDKKIL